MIFIVLCVTTQQENCLCQASLLRLTNDDYSTMANKVTANGKVSPAAHVDGNGVAWADGCTVYTNIQMCIQTFNVRSMY